MKAFLSITENFKHRFRSVCKQFADELTKPKIQGSLLKLLRTGKRIVECEQWIIRPKHIRENYEAHLRSDVELKWWD